MRLYLGEDLLDNSKLISDYPNLTSESILTLKNYEDQSLVAPAVENKLTRLQYLQPKTKKKRNCI